MGGAQTIGTRVAAADDDDVLVASSDWIIVGDVGLMAAPILRRQILHREVNALKLAARHGQVARNRRSAGEDDGVEFAAELLHRQIDADVHTGPESHPFLAHQHQAPIEHLFFELELGNAVAQQPTNAIGPLQHGDPVPGAIQLIRRGETRRAGANHRDPLSGPARRRPRHHAPFGEATIDDGNLD